ncbi:MAG: hypothetical protein KAK04_12185, partial [Cyclobacteriaceae bacterium]|nr:hypothetical protein [Cyclobacteriaceae bacterium]
MGKVFFFYIFLALGFNQITEAQTAINSSGNSVTKFQPDLIVIKFKTLKSSNGRVSFSPESQLKKLRKSVDYTDHHQVFANKSFSNARSSSSGL